MEGDDQHASQVPMNDNNVNVNMNNNNVNMNNINPYILDYMNTPLINNPLFQYPSSSSSPVLPQLPLTMSNQLDNNNISLESSNVDWVSLLSGFVNVDQGSMGGRGLSEADDKIAARSSKSMKSGRGKKVTPSRVAFHTRSSEDILDDGYKWRKYGQKSVKNSHHPRCTHHTCNVKKQIQRLSKDNSIVVTTYEGIHNHPCEKLMETLTPLLKQLQFLSRF
ncbi:WRKY domain-containing protein [Artemisia annua]|uniref:WRKY domain-containing protein n=1 Tax=Artemisia annua TaxID=35608 RepID=A0A2U1Q7E3_ARTAN|nr:WRKY domain-containing protein [Artemisia annua]